MPLNLVLITISGIGALFCGIPLLFIGYAWFLYSFSRQGDWQDAAIGLIVICIGGLFFHYGLRLLCEGSSIRAIGRMTGGTVAAAMEVR